MRAVLLILEARERAGLSQAELARRAGLPRSVLNAYERAKREPGGDMVIRILAAAGFDVRLEPHIDADRNARILEQVHALAEGLPCSTARKTGPTSKPPPLQISRVSAKRLHIS